MGSSTVMMWQARVSLISLMSEASVVDLPEPVGPVTRNKPRGGSTSWMQTSGTGDTTADRGGVGWKGDS